MGEYDITNVMSVGGSNRRHGNPSPTVPYSVPYEFEARE